MSNYWRDTRDHDALLGIEDHRPTPPPERCPKHGLYEFTLWAGCPSCEDEDEAAFEAERAARRERFDSPLRYPQRKPAA